MDLKTIEKLTEDHTKDRRLLADIVRDLEAHIAEYKRKVMPHIKKAVARASESRQELQAAIEESPALFKKPRTHIFHGVKIGYEKQKGVMVIANEDRTVERLKDMFGVCADTYIKTEEKPIKKALATLPGADLKKLGVRVEDDTDKIVIRPMDSEIEKLVDALLKDSAEEKEAAA